MPAVIFQALWLVSERDASARRITFSPTKNLLAGENETGKSRVLKHLVWALGCEPTARTAGNWDSNIAAAVYLQIGNKPYIFLRYGRHQRAAFDGEGNLLCATESGSTWAEFFAEAFGYRLKLQRHKEGVFGLAGPEYAVLPFYIDQEGGWTRKWANFTKLSQFVRWEPVVFEAFTGLRPQRYFHAQLQRDEVNFKLREARAQTRVQSLAFEQVAKMLPVSEAQLDEALFADELTKLTEQVAELVREEDAVRTALFDTAQARQEKTAELQMAARAEMDLVADLAYLSKVPDDGHITCPTCGQEHSASFRARFDLATDAKDAHELVIHARQRLDQIGNREQDLRAKLNRISRTLEQLRSSMEEKKDGQSLTDIVAAKSRSTLELAYDATRRDGAALIDELEGDLKVLQDELSGLTEKGREKTIRDGFKEALRSYADRLNIAKAEIGSVRIGARPPMGAGSSGPRIYLAMHMALLSMNKQYGDGPVFPFIIDTPRQQGLDDSNTAKLLNAIFNHAMSHQIFVANESVPAGWTPPEGCQVLEFAEKRQLLRADEYAAGVQALTPLIAKLAEAVEAERDRAAADGGGDADEGDAPGGDPLDSDELDEE